MNRARTSSLASLRAVLVAAMSLLACASARATPADDAERVRLGQERAAIDAQFAVRQNECNQRFVVTSCVEDARRDRRRALDALRSRQIVLDESRRKELSAARRSELSANAAEAARREAGRASRPPAAASEPAARRDEPIRSPEARHPATEGLQSAKRHAVAGAAASGPKGAAAAAERQSKEGRSRATFEARKQQAAEHREDVVNKTIQRMQERPAARALPVPAVIPAP